MSWASERCKSQSTSHRSAELSNASLNAAEHRLALPRYVELCHRPPVTIKPAPQLLAQSSASHRSASLCFALQYVTDQCSVQPRPVSLHHRSRFTIKTCSPSAALRGEADVSPRYALPLIAAHCFAHPRCALHRSPIVPSSRLKLGLMSASPSW